MTMTRANKNSSSVTTENDLTNPVVSPNGPDISSFSSTLQLRIHKLNGKNYLECAQTMKLAIDGRGKLWHLTGEVKKPAADDPKLATWKFENFMITT